MHNSAPGGPTRISAVIRWRAEAIERVITALGALVPISHVVFGEAQGQRLGSDPTPAERRQQLIETYGVRDTHGNPQAVCAYCLTSSGPIEVDHLLPRSRGGTDAWANLTLACSACNSRKGERTPEEAGMPLLIKRGTELFGVQRAAPYRIQTTLLLQRQLRKTGLIVSTPSDLNLNSGLNREVAAIFEGHYFDKPVVVAKPVARGRKQRYSSRFYPIHTSGNSGFLQVNGVMRKMTRVNRALKINRNLGRIRVDVVSVDNELDLGREEQTIIHIGMLCTAVRAGRKVLGIVNAVHTAGRLTLQALGDVQPNRVRWRRIVVSPRQNLRVLSNAGVVFLRPEKL